MIRGSIRDVRRRPGLVAAQLAGYAALLPLFWFWLSLPERTASDLALSALLFLLIATGFLWLQSVALSAFHPGVDRAWRTAFRRLARFLPWGLAINGVLAAGFWTGLLSGYPVWLAGAAAAILLVPPASAAAGGGFRRGGTVRVWGSGGFWLAAGLCLVAGTVLPAALVWFVPPVTGLAAETASAALRLGAAYVLAVAAWLTLAAAVGRIGGEAAGDGGR